MERVSGREENVCKPRREKGPEDVGKMEESQCVWRERLMRWAGLGVSLSLIPRAVGVIGGFILFI